MSATMTPQQTVERALQLSRTDDCIVIADETSGANLRWAGNTLTTNGVNQSSRLTVIALAHRADGVAAGIVSRVGVGPDRIEDVVREAEAAAAQSGPAEDAEPLPDGAGGAVGGSVGRRAREDRDRHLRGFRAGARGGLRRGEEGRPPAVRVRRARGDDHVPGHLDRARLRSDQPTGKVELNAKSADLTRSAWVGVGTRDFRDVDVDALSTELGRRLAWGERRLDLPAGRYETLLPPTATADLITYLYWSMGARDAHEGRTVFSRPGGGTRVGETLASLPVRLFSDPAAPGLECAPFHIAHASGRESSLFDNGLPLPATDWISDGKLNALMQTRHSAGLTGLPLTLGVENLLMEGPSPQTAPTLDEMIAGTERGLLLTCLWYIREVDPQSLLLTGLTRDGVYLVEGGEVVGEVNNFRFNESPVGMLSRLAEVGRAQHALGREWSDYFTRTAMPPLRIADFNMSTVSQAS